MQKWKYINPNFPQKQNRVEKFKRPQKIEEEGNHHDYDMDSSE